jgi:hypothetical protein
MKAILLLSFMLFSLSALADTFVCEIEADGKFSIGYEMARTRKVRARVSTWACDGKIKGDEIIIQMYEPHLQVDGELYETRGPVHRGVTLVTPYSKCMCSLM